MAVLISEHVSDEKQFMCDNCFIEIKFTKFREPDPKELEDIKCPICQSDMNKIIIEGRIEPS